MFEVQEQNRVQNCSRRISKLMYGKNGMLAFLHQLFGLLHQKQKHHMTYYFAMRNQLKDLLEHERQQRGLKKKRNELIKEEEEEEMEIQEYGQQSPENKFQRVQPHYKNSLFFEPHQTPLDIQKRCRYYSHSKAVLSNASSSQHSQTVFKSEHEFFQVESWDTHSLSVRRTYQFTLFLSKLYEANECPVDGYGQIFCELLHFPPNKMTLFPTLHFLNIWESLSQSQQQDMFIKLSRKR